MQTFIYRWQERAGEQGKRNGNTDGPVLEIRGDAESLFTVAKRLELPERPFWSEFLNLDGTPADIWAESADAAYARRSMEAEKALADKATAEKARERVWVRVGDAGDCTDVGDVYGAVDDLNEMQVGKVTAWVDGPRLLGFETPNYHGNDGISCFWGDADCNMTRALNADERRYLENTLKDVLN